MRKLFLMGIIFMIVLTSESAFADEKLAGIWEGKLSVQGTQLRIVFNISAGKNNTYTAIMDSPDQGAKGLPVSEVNLSGDSIRLNVPFVGGYYEGVVNFAANKITGSWNQSGMTFPLELIKVEKVGAVKRPQTPREPFPYKSEEITFLNEAENIKLAGTLTIPEGSGEFPFVILVSGSGPQDRDETLFNHKPFYVLADYLTKNGIGVLRYDDRGISRSEGNFATATTTDFVNDASAAADYLSGREDLKINKLGIIGHSEGGLVAPLAALKNSKVNFIVMLAGPSLQGDELLELQSGSISRAAGAPEEMIERNGEFSGKIYLVLKNETDTSVIRKQITELFTDYFDVLTKEEKKNTGDLSRLLEQSIKAFMSPWFREFIQYDPKPVLKKTTIPVLALYGEKDLQVPPKENIKRLETALSEAENQNYRIIQLPNLNHLFQNAKTGSPAEYSTIQETFSTEALEIIKNWINTITQQI